MPLHLNRLTEGWLELESDPGLFTLLLEDFGVRGVQVEEIYDLQKPIEGPVYGFIFLFKWIEERRSRRKVVVTEESFVENEEIVNSIFFAQQMVPNSCATHALLSVLLNCSKIHLGPTLARLKEHTSDMDPENKGYAIGNTPELARAHNSHAKPEPRHRHEKTHGISTGKTMEAFHFVSYVPISGRLFELDGLKPFPIDHGPWAEGEDWTEKFRRVITERLGIATGEEPYHDIRFNLMAVVPDRRIAYEQKLRTLKTNRQIVLEALQQLVKLTHPELTSDDHAAYLAAMNKGKSKKNKNSDNEAKSNDDVHALQSASIYPKLPAALDSHNYAKSPLMEGVRSRTSESQPRYEDYSDSDYSDEETRPVSKSKPKLTDSAHVKDEKVILYRDENSSQFLNPEIAIKTEPSSPGSLQPLSINTSADLMKPLTIQTKFQPSPTPSASSTDTSSEAGSAFNSPVRSVGAFAQGSPNSVAKIMSKHGETQLLDDVRDIKKFVVIRVTTTTECTDSEDKENEQSEGLKSEKTSFTEKPKVVDTDLQTKRHHTTDTSSGDENDHLCKQARIEDSSDISLPSSETSSCSAASGDQTKQDHKYKGSDLNKGSQRDSEYSPQRKSDNSKLKNKSPNKHPHLTEPHKFAPKDLLALLKTVENEISLCENNLHDEIEKRKKYKIDDCRRTHNYDQFICTFLSMLAEQGKLADLVEQQLLVRRRQGIRVGRLHKTKKPDRRKKSRPKKKK